MKMIRQLYCNDYIACVFNDGWDACNAFVLITGCPIENLFEKSTLMLYNKIGLKRMYLEYEM